MTGLYSGKKGTTMHLDISDVTIATKELVRLLRDYRQSLSCLNEDPGTILHNGKLHFPRMMSTRWETELVKIQRRDEIVMYHVCRQDQEGRILHHGIFHDESPTLTLSLVGAIAQAENYQELWRPSSILQAIVPILELEFCYIDHLGPGFLPKARKSRKEISLNALPDELMRYIFETKGQRFARWLDPKYLKESIYQTSSQSQMTLLNALR